MGADQHPGVAGQNSPTALTLDLATLGSSAPGALHRFHCGATSQSAQKPCLLSGSLLKLAPIERSGTQTMAFFTPGWSACPAR
jgi:hypothetical protein